MTMPYYAMLHGNFETHRNMQPPTWPNTGGNGATATTAFFDSRCGVERCFLSFHPPRSAARSPSFLWKPLPSRIGKPGRKMQTAVRYGDPSLKFTVAALNRGHGAAETRRKSSGKEKEKSTMAWVHCSLIQENLRLVTQTPHLNFRHHIFELGR